MSHTGENVAKLLRDVVEEWKMLRNGIVLLIVHNASNVVLAATKVDFVHLKCTYAHIANLAV